MFPMIWQASLAAVELVGDPEIRSGKTIYKEFNRQLHCFDNDNRQAYRFFMASPQASEDGDQADDQSDSQSDDQRLQYSGGKSSPHTWDDNAARLPFRRRCTDIVGQHLFP